MGYRYAVTCLAPIFWAQGLYVRRVTPRLPEPTGDRCGVKGNGESLCLLITGDSAAAGVGADSQSSALSGQLVSALAPHFLLSWRLIARTGCKIHDVIKILESADQEKFDMAVVSVGVNDVTGGTSSRQWQDLLDNLCNLLTLKFGVKHILLSSVPPMHLFPALPMPLRWYLGKKALSLNDAMKRFTKTREVCEFVQSAIPLTKEYIASDGFHPGPAAYTIWAETMATVIKQKC